MNLSTDFVSGVISINTTFYHTHTPTNNQFGFQIKVPCETFELLREIGRTLGLSRPPKIYGRTATLHTRSTQEIIHKIMPFCDDRLYGQKLAQYIKWKQEFIKYYGTLEKDA